MKLELVSSIEAIQRAIAMSASNCHDRSFETNANGWGWVWEWTFVLLYCFLLLFLLLVRILQLKYCNVSDSSSSDNLHQDQDRHDTVDDVDSDEEEDDDDDDEKLSALRHDYGSARRKEVKFDRFEESGEQPKELTDTNEDGVVQRPVLTNKAINQHIDMDLRLSNPHAINSEFGISDTDMAYLASKVKQLNYAGCQYIHSVVNFRKTKIMKVYLDQPCVPDTTSSEYSD